MIWRNSRYSPFSIVISAGGETQVSEICNIRSIVCVYVCVCLQELIASLPQPSGQDLDMTVERATLPDVVSEEKSSFHNETPTPCATDVDTTQAPANKVVPLVTIEEDDSTTEVTEPSASEEQLRGAVQEHE